MLGAKAPGWFISLLVIEVSNLRMSTAELPTRLFQARKLLHAKTSGGPIDSWGSWRRDTAATFKVFDGTS